MRRAGPGSPLGPALAALSALAVGCGRGGPASLASGEPAGLPLSPSAQAPGPSLAPASPGPSSSTALLPPRPPYDEPPEAREIASGAIERLETDAGWAPFFTAKVGGRPALVLLASKDAPQRWRAHVALYRLARLLEAQVVPPTIGRSLPLAQLLGSADAAAAARIADEAQVRPDGTVMAAVSLLPDGTRPIAAQWSVERARWERLTESPSPPPADAAREAEGFASMVVLDYVAGNVLRQRVEQGPSGELVLLHNRGAFAEHPEPFAVEQQLARVKRLARAPGPLEAALERLGEAELDAALRPGGFDEWLVQRRPLREALVRARAAASVFRARRAAEGPPSTPAPR